MKENHHMSTPITGDPAYCNLKVAEKVIYEYTMFTFLYGLLRYRVRESVTFQPGDVTYVGTGSESDEELQTTYALLESYLLHARVLHDFFHKPQSRDDVVAGHFVSGWETLRPPQDPYLAEKNRRNRLDKALAHLTLERLNYDAEEKRWNVDAIRDAIDEPMKAFLEKLPKDRKAWFKIAK
jgi:hypothetical protein